MKKLEWYGVSGSLLQWIEDLITNRTMRVVVDGQQSTWSEFESGVPQGSVLGLLLFLIYVNEIPTLLSSKVKLFADDTKLWRTIS